MSNFESVKKFMLTFGQEVKNKADFPEEKIVKLRFDLIQEELNEFKTAIEQRDIKEVADALTDILYVTYVQHLQVTCPNMHMFATVPAGGVGDMRPGLVGPLCVVWLC